MLIVATALASSAARTDTLSGQVIDASTQRPIENAIVTANETAVRTSWDGTFRINGAVETLGVRAYGHQRATVSVNKLGEFGARIRLAPFEPKGLYLSFYGIGSAKLRQSALDLIGKTELNAVVIDVKGDRGLIAYKSSVPLAAQVGAQRLITFADARALLERLHREHIYTIARIVVFKDDPLATSKPELAVRRSSGAIFRDREKLAWTDPFRQEVWNYNIAIATEAASLGFDEIQFDYVRFPDAPGLRFSKPVNLQSRLAAITGFLGAAWQALARYNVFVAADVFGYVTWNLDDTHIGQQLEELSPVVDYISPMLYPSCFQFGIPGYRLPVAHPYEIVFLSLQNARERTGIPAIRFRPWLQAFRDYAFDRRQYGAKEIRAQISAAEKFGSDGWMLWNPRNIYTAAGLKEEGKPCLNDSSK